MNLSDLIPSIFSTQVENFFQKAKELAGQVESFGSGLQNAPALIKQRAAAVMVKYNEVSAKAGASLCNIISDGFNVPGVERDIDGDAILRGETCLSFMQGLLHTMGYSSDTHLASNSDFASFEVADGRFANVQHGGDGEHLWYEQAFDINAPYMGGDGEELFGIEFRPGDDETEPWCLISVDSPEGETSPEEAIDAIAFIAESRASDADFLMSCLNVAANKGHITLTDTLALSQGLPDSSIVRSVIEKVTEADTIDFNLISSIALQVLDSSKGEVNDDNSGYTPYELPTMNHNVLGIVLELVGQALSIVLTVIFGAIGWVFTVVWELLSKLTSVVMSNVAKTLPDVKELTVTPAINVPVTPLVQLSTTAALSSEILEALETGPIAMAISDPRKITRSPGYLVLIPTYDTDGDIANVAAQVILSFECGANAPAYSDLLGTVWGSFSQVNPDQPNGFDVQGTRQSYDITSSGQSPVDYGYITTASDRSKALNWIGMNYASVLNLLGERKAQAGSSFDTDTTTYVVTFSGSSSVHSVNTAFQAFLEGDASPSLTRAAAALQFSATYLADMYAANGSGIYTPYSFAELLEDVITPMYNRGNEFWERVIRGFLYERQSEELDEYSSDFPYRFVRVNLPDVATPAVDYPSVSSSDIWKACILLAASAAAVTAGTLLWKRHRKKKATANLAAKQQAFEDAQSAYQSNPTAANAQALDKANRRLTRAWNRAGRAGVSMYNGFATGGGSESFASAVNAMRTQQTTEGPSVAGVLARIG